MAPIADKPSRKTARTESVPQISTLRIELRGTTPLIWRELDVPVSVTLTVLHEIIQAAMGWADAHLWEFTIGGETYGCAMEDGFGDEQPVSPEQVRVHEVLNPRKTTFLYTYDFGDTWEHRITLSRVRAGDAGLTYPRYTAGKGACPPEDCGGIPGFYEMRDVLADPAHPDHDEVAEHFEGWDAEIVDENRIAAALARIATSKPGGRQT